MTFFLTFSRWTPKISNYLLKIIKIAKYYLFFVGTQNSRICLYQMIDINETFRFLKEKSGHAHFSAFGKNNLNDIQTG